MKELRPQHVQVMRHFIHSLHVVLHIEVLHTFSSFFFMCFTLSCLSLQRIRELEASAVPHKFLYVDEAGFNLAMTSNCGRNVIGQRAAVQTPGQRGSSVTLCTTISDNGPVAYIPTVGPYNSVKLCSVLDDLYALLLAAEQRQDAGVSAHIM